jgi:hypothetical protein
VSRIRSALIALALVAPAAFAEGIDTRSKKPDTPSRLHGLTTMLPMPNGGFLTVGGSNLRMLAPGGRQFTSLHRIPKDSLYRVASNKAGDVLAAWEKDASLHYFTGTPRRHVTLPKPKPPTDALWGFQVGSLAFLENGRDVLVHMEGHKKPRGEVSIAYRVPLDGGAPELLYRVEEGRQLDRSRDVALYLIPERPDQTCEHRTCNPVRAVVAYELTAHGVKHTVLLDGRATPVSNARMIWGNTDEQVFLELSLERNERAVLRWRPGQPKADIRPFPKFASYDERLFSTNSGDVLQLLNHQEEALVIHRHTPDGKQDTLRLPASNDPDTIDSNLHALGLRKNGALWMHWGDFVLLFDVNLARNPRAYSVEPLLTRRTEWADVAVYVQEPEVLWIGIEVGRGRDFARVPFAEMEKRAKPWHAVRSTSTEFD